MIIIEHDGKADFPHGAGPSDEGWYVYPDGDLSHQPNGPYYSEEEAECAAVYMLMSELQDKLAKMEPMVNKMDVTLRCAIQDFERRYNGLHPVCILACRGGADEHWQLFHPDALKQDEPMPLFTIDKDGVGYEHH
jgi:hypothetical protein